MVNQSLVTREQTLCSRRGGGSCRFCLNSALAREIGRIERGSFPRARKRVLGPAACRRRAYFFAVEDEDRKVVD